MEQKRHHSVDYIEIQGIELDSLQDFYASAFGWTFTTYSPNYRGFHDAGDQVHEAGGIAKAESEATVKAPMAIIYSDALESSLAAVEAAGGKITRPIFSFPGGRRFEFLDPCGNSFGVWSAT